MNCLWFWEWPDEANERTNRWARYLCTLCSMERLSPEEIEQLQVGDISPE